MKLNDENPQNRIATRKMTSLVTENINLMAIPPARSTELNLRSSLDHCTAPFESNVLSNMHNSITILEEPIIATLSKQTSACESSDKHTTSE